LSIFVLVFVLIFVILIVIFIILIILMLQLLKHCPHKSRRGISTFSRVVLTAHML
jgi:hypothetical protein